MSELMATNDPEIISSELAAELAAIGETVLTESEAKFDDAASSTELDDKESAAVVIEFPEDLLTNETYLHGINELVTTIDPDSVNEEVFYVDYGTFYNVGGELPDYTVVFQCNGVDVIFPTDYAEEIIVTDGMLINLGSNYTAGLQIDGYDVSNYLSSEITIPTYHSATWYQYLQSYGQPYRIVDRYVNNYGSISSSTRSSVAVEWSGGNPWAGFTFDRIAMFITIVILFMMFIFRKGSK